MTFWKLLGALGPQDLSVIIMLFAEWLRIDQCEF